MTLNNASPGRCYLIERILSPREARLCLKAKGITEGSSVLVIGKRGFGTVIKSHGATFALDDNTARGTVIKRLDCRGLGAK